MFEIEKGIEIPKITGTGRKAIYPFGEMEIGDSFYAPVRVDPISAAAIMFAKTHPPLKFTCRREGEGTRCWRIA